MDELRTAKSNSSVTTETTQKKPKSTKNSQRKKTSASKSTGGNTAKTAESAVQTKKVVYKKFDKNEAAANISSDERREMIAKAAFIKAEQRGFSGGNPVDDWLAAETEVDALLASNLSQQTPI